MTQVKRCKNCDMVLASEKDYGTNADGSKNDEYCLYCLEDGLLAKECCQSCGMPLRKEEDFGTNADGSKSEEYCGYCYQKGAYTQDCTMEDMIDTCLEYTKDSDMYTDREEARKQLLEWFPTLKRWKQQA